MTGQAVRCGRASRYGGRLPTWQPPLLYYKSRCWPDASLEQGSSSNAWATMSTLHVPDRTDWS